MADQGDEKPVSMIDWFAKVFCEDELGQQVADDGLELPMSFAIIYGKGRSIGGRLFMSSGQLQVQHEFLPKDPGDMEMPVNIMFVDSKGRATMAEFVDPDATRIFVN